jgi:predicted small integral membrane protein
LPQEAAPVIGVRIGKVIMVGCLAIWASLVTFNNLTDYDSNFEFVQHVLSMDTTFPSNALMYRRVTSPALWEAAYAVIILGEGLTAATLFGAAVVLLRHVHSPAVCFNRSKCFVVIGVGLGFLVWFFGFMVIGGEWFAMWQSSRWNGQQAAFRFYMTLLAVLIFVIHPDAEGIDAGPRRGE